VVLQQIKDCETKKHSKLVYDGQKKCPLKHFDIALTSKSDCIDGLDNLSSCQWSLETVVLDP